MKYELETIPVWDAFKIECECPLCILEQKHEKNNIKFFLGDSVMDPDTRVKVNAKGFCSYHFELMFQSDHKLGVGLMTHTHLTDFLKAIKEISSKTQTLLEKNKGSDAIQLISEYIINRNNTCAFCDRLARTLDRYTFTIVYLWKKDEAFKKVIESSRGFCMKHLPRVCTMASEVLSGKLLAEFIQIIISLNIERLEIIEQQLLWYTQKFDFRNKDKPWNDSKDALIRTLQKLKGHVFYNQKEERNG